MVVPILEDLLSWTEFETSLFFCGAGVEVRTYVWLFLCIIIIIIKNVAHLFICCADATKQEDK